MPRIIYLALFCLLPLLTLAQKDSAVYLRFPAVPAFQLINLADSSRFTKDDLANNKASVFIIFNPFCDHCKHETEELTANIGLFKQAQIIMASPIDYTYLKKFYNDYKIANYPNIIMGRDPGNFLGTFFNVQSIPSVYVYDKQGKFIIAFERPESVKKIAEIL
jgi:thiol-disulfide isomerase/thioredoxin